MLRKAFAFAALGLLLTAGPALASGSHEEPRDGGVWAFNSSDSFAPIAYATPRRSRMSRTVWPAANRCAISRIFFSPIP